MAFRIAEVYTRLVVSDRDFNRGMDAANKKLGEHGKASDKAAGSVKKLTDAQKREIAAQKAATDARKQAIAAQEKMIARTGVMATALGTFAGNVLTRVTSSMLGAAKSVAAFGLEAADMASDVNESLSKNQTLFGQHAKGVEKWAQSTAASIGTSRREALAAAGGFGNLLRGMNFSQGASATLSQQLVTTAADLASFNNTSVESALESLRSGLIGESEPLRAYGVMLTDAALRQEALRMGLVSTTKDALIPQTRAMATLSLITKQTTAAQGDALRTANGAANTQKRLIKVVDDLKVSLGEAVLPLKKEFLDAMLTVSAAVKANMPQIKAAITSTIAAIKPLVASVTRFGSEMASGFARDMPRLKKAAIEAFAPIKPLVAETIAWFRENYPLIKQTVQTVLTTVAEFWKAHGKQIVAVVRPMVQGILAALKLVMQLINGDFKGSFKSLKDIIVSSFNVRQQVETLLVSLFVDIEKRVLTAAGKVGTSIWQGIVGGLNAGKKAVTDTAASLALDIPGTVANLLQIRSPSQVLFAQGLFAATGFALGLEAGIPKAALASAKMASAAHVREVAASKAKDGKHGVSHASHAVKLTDSEKQDKAFTLQLGKQQAILKQLQAGFSVADATLAGRFPLVAEAKRGVLAGVENRIRELRAGLESMKAVADEIANVRREIAGGAIGGALGDLVAQYGGKPTNGMKRLAGLTQERDTARTARGQIIDARKQALLLNAPTQQDAIAAELFGKYYASLTDAKNKTLVNKVFTAQRSLSEATDRATEATVAGAAQTEEATRTAGAYAQVTDTLQTALSDLGLEHAILNAADLKHRASLELTQRTYESLSASQKQFVDGILKERKAIADTQATQEKWRTFGTDAANMMRQGAGNIVTPAFSMLPKAGDGNGDTLSERAVSGATGNALKIADVFSSAINSGITAGFGKGNAAKAFADSLKQSLVGSFQSLITDTLKTSATRLVEQGIKGTLSPTMKDLRDSVTGSVEGARASVGQMVGQAYGLLSALGVGQTGKKKKSGLLGSILGGIAGAFIPGVGPMIGAGIGGNLAQGNIAGAVMSGLSLLPGSGGGMKFNKGGGVGSAPYGPGFANGGRTPVGTPFWVGERGPELMRFDAPGTVVPNYRTGAEGSRYVAPAASTGYAGGGVGSDTAAILRALDSLSGAMKGAAQSLRPVEVAISATGWNVSHEADEQRVLNLLGSQTASLITQMG